MKTKTQKIVIASLFSAIICIATFIIKIPTPLKGYVNLGDGIVLLAGWLLSPAYGFLSAAIGSLFADIFSGYAFYAPATFVIKGLVALVACLLLRFFSSKSHKIIAQVISAVLAELVMIFGYYIFEGFLYGFSPALVNIPANAFQAIAGIIVGTVLINIFQKYKKLQ